MITVYVGSADRFAMCEPVIRYSIVRHARVAVDVRVIRPETLGVPLSGCTGFTNLRYAVPELNGFAGFAVYLDVDMLVLDDVLELAAYRQPGRWVQTVDGDNEVSVIDCAALRGKLPPLAELHHFNKWQLMTRLRGLTRSAIPAQWNVKDHATPDAKLIHFTNLDAQPWFYGIDSHPCKAACDLWYQYQREALDHEARLEVPEPPSTADISEVSV